MLFYRHIFAISQPLLKTSTFLFMLLVWCTPSIADEGKMKLDPSLFDRVLVAAYAGDKSALIAFAEAGDINALDDQGLSAVLHSVMQNRLDATQLLIDAGADVDAYDPGLSVTIIDQTAFLYAGATGNNAALNILLLAHARTDIVNYYGGTALIPAAEKGHVDTVRLLLEKSSVDINHVNNLGWTALMEAVLLSDGGPDQQHIVTLLLEHGADPEIADRDGITALQHATSKGYEKIVQLLTSLK